MNFNEPNEKSTVISKTNTSPEGEGLYSKAFDPERISEITEKKYEYLEFKEIKTDFIKISSEVIQAVNIPVQVLSDYEKIKDSRVGKLITKTLYRVSSLTGDIKERDGLYVFQGLISPSNKRIIYIGKASSSHTRFKTHKKRKDENFSKILIITCSSDDNFGENMLKCLESLLIITLKDHPGYELANKQEKTKYYVDDYDMHILEKNYTMILDLIERTC